MTIKEALKASKVPVGLSGKSVRTAEALLLSEENIYFAACLNYKVSSERFSGVVIVTSHRILFCSAIFKNVHAVSFDFERSISCTEPTRGIVCKTTINYDNISAIVEGNLQVLQLLIEALNHALVDYSDVTPIHIPPDTHKTINENTGESALPANEDDLIKICSACGDRLLYGARRCPSCKSKELISVSRNDTAQIEALIAAGNPSLRTPLSQPHLSKKQIAEKRVKDNRNAGVACCPKCGSTSLSANKKGFSTGKAVVGATIAPIGILAGNIGANKLIVTCLNCGHTFKPGKK